MIHRESKFAVNPDVRFRELMLRLQPDEAALNQLLEDIVASARAQAKGENAP